MLYGMEALLQKLPVEHRQRIRDLASRTGLGDEAVLTAVVQLGLEAVSDSDILAPMNPTLEPKNPPQNAAA